jgi:hypothetical protein
MYRLEVYPEAQEQIDALPLDAASALAEVRRWKFGPHAEGQVIYLVLEHQREVHIVMIQWWG